MWLEFVCISCRRWGQTAVFSFDNGIFCPARIGSDDPSSHFQGVLDRFSQIQPKLIFSVEAVIYNGKEHGHLEKLQRVVKGISGPALGVCMYVCKFVCSRSPEFTCVHVCAHRDGALPRSSGCMCMCTKRGVAPEVLWATPPKSHIRIVLGACADNSWCLTLSHPSFRTA